MEWKLMSANSLSIQQPEFIYNVRSFMLDIMLCKLLLKLHFVTHAVAVTQNYKIYRAANSIWLVFA